MGAFTVTSSAALLPVLVCGTAGRAMPGQTESGDGYVVVPCHGGTLVAVIDGLGHGPHAAAATRVAIEVLDAQADGSGDDLAALVRSCHTQLVGTRGAVMTLAFFSESLPRMTWLSVGNVEGALFRPDPGLVTTRVVIRGGVVGGSLPSLHSSQVVLTSGDLMILSTDGIDSRFAAKIDRGARPAQIAQEALAGFAKDTDDALVLVARWTDSL